jgi:hypothetical protein
MRRAALALLLFATVIGADAPPSANALLAKHKAYVGWEAGDGGVASWVATTTIPVVRPGSAPLVGLVSTEFRRGLDFRTNFPRTPPLETTDGANGDRYWRSNINANVVDLAERALRRAVSGNLLSGEGTTLPAPATLRGTAEVDGAPTTIVRIAPATAVPMDLYEDDAGAYRRVVVDPESSGATTYTIVRYVELAPGKRAIGAYRIGTRDTEYSVAYRRVGMPIEPAAIAPPKPASHWTFDDAQTAIPVEVRHENNNDTGSVIVDVTVDGRKGRFILDSGAGGILLFKHFGDDASFTPVGRTEITGINGGRVQSDLVRVKELAVGANVLHDVIVERSSGDTFQKGLDGLIGFDFLAQAIVDVDVAHGAMHIYDPVKIAPSVGKNANLFAIDLSNYHIVVPAQVGEPKGAPAHLTVDTGNAIDLLLSDDMRTHGGVVVLGNGRTRYMSGVDGRMNIPVPCMLVSALRLGRFRYPNIDICFGSPSVFGTDGGLLGFGFLQHFDWTFDYPDARLLLTANGK